MHDTTTRLGDLFYVADDLASQIADLGYEVASVDVSRFGNLSFMLDRPQYESTLIGLLVDLGCININGDSHYSISAAQGSLTENVSVRVFTWVPVSAVSA